MLIIVGESASGKSTVEGILSKCYGYKKIVSYTTRSPRNGEVEGKDYCFVSDEEFNRLKESGFFIETACYNGWNYGTPKNNCVKDSVLVATPHGLRQIKKLNDKVFSVYINVPRRDRLIKILQRGDGIEESYRRNLSDLGQYDGIEDDVDYIIYNEKYAKSAKTVADEINRTYEKWIKRGVRNK